MKRGRVLLFRCIPRACSLSSSGRRNCRGSRPRRPDHVGDFPPRAGRQAAMEDADHPRRRRLVKTERIADRISELTDLEIRRGPSRLFCYNTCPVRNASGTARVPQSSYCAKAARRVVPFRTVNDKPCSRPHPLFPPPRRRAPSCFWPSPALPARRWCAPCQNISKINTSC